MSVHAFYFCDNSIFSSLLVFCEDLHVSTHRRQLVTTTADFSTACLSYDFLPKLCLKFTPSPILLFIYYAKKKKRISHSKSTTNARRKKFFSAHEIKNFRQPTIKTVNNNTTTKKKIHAQSNSTLQQQQQLLLLLLLLLPYFFHFFFFFFKRGHTHTHIH